jgi:hypothetical protein
VDGWYWCEQLVLLCTAQHWDAAHVSACCIFLAGHRTGIFPANYVEKLPEGYAPPAKVPRPPLPLPCSGTPGRWTAAEPCCGASFRRAVRALALPKASLSWRSVGSRCAAPTNCAACASARSAQCSQRAAQLIVTNGPPVELGARPGSTGQRVVRRLAPPYICFTLGVSKRTECSRSHMSGW